MNAKVDVLEVLACSITNLLHEDCIPPADPQAVAEMYEKARAATAELIEAATSAKNALAIIAASEESDTSDKWYQLLFDDLPRLRAALARVGGAK